jgi:hypothetical protein
VKRELRARGRERRLREAGFLGPDEEERAHALALAGIA